jgi:peptidoglycan lytic transglycosylase G
MKHKNILYFLAGAIVSAIIILFIIYRNLFGINVTADRNKKIIYIPTGSSYEQVLDTLESNLKINDLSVFNWLAKKKKYPALIKPGRYVISSPLSYNSLINLLRSGKQTPVRITFSNVNTLNDIAGKIGHQLEADSSKIIGFLSDESNYAGDGFRKETIISIFIPDTYEFYWNTDAKGLYTRMLKGYRLFWNEQRLAKAKKQHLNPSEVATLASIIDDEVAKTDEKPRIAGVYLNRLRRGIPLQADPTIKFALKNNSITRILKKDLLVDSPYNTYKHAGLPPGPIGCPTIDGIDAVLNAEKNDFLFFAAKNDFSGYHNFSRTLSEHNKYASLYQKELNKRKIFK